MRKGGELSADLLISLMLFYGVFVIGDVVTTFWLIVHSPEGIAGEASPIGRFLYENYGFAGMIAGKIAAFLAFSLAVVSLWSKYVGVRWFEEALETIILAMSGYSALVVVNNVASIAYVSALLGTPPREALRVLAAVLTLSLIGAVARAIFKETARFVASLIGILVALMPLIFWPKLNVLLYTGYVATLFVLIILSFYYVEEVVLKV